MNTSHPFINQPIGRIFSILGKGYLELLRLKLKHLEIDRYYFALILIDSHKGNISQQELANLLESDKVTIVRVINYLAEKGYVKRCKLTDDKRKRTLVLTEKAQSYMPEIKNAVAEINEIALSLFDNEEIIKLDNLLKRVKQNINNISF